MKLNTRTLAFATAFVGFSLLSSNANAVRFYLAYGDDTLVTLAKSVQFGGVASDATAAIGKEIPIGVALRIPKIADNQKFKLQVRLDSGAGTQVQFNSGATYVGVDQRAGTSGNTATHTAGDGKIGFGDNTTAANNVAGLGSLPNAAGGADLQLATQGAPAFSSVAGSGTGVRGTGIWFGFQFGTGNKVQLAASTNYLLYTLELKNTGLANFDIYGDGSGENGVSIDTPANNNTSRSNFVTTTTDKAYGWPVPGPKYSVQAVPEPGSIFAIAAGLVALGLRRKKA